MQGSETGFYWIEDGELFTVNMIMLAFCSMFKNMTLPHLTLPLFFFNSKEKVVVQLQVGETGLCWIEDGELFNVNMIMLAF